MIKILITMIILFNTQPSKSGVCFTFIEYLKKKRISQFGPSTFQALNSHMTSILDRIAL